jgi:hypothetical protein
MLATALIRRAEAEGGFGAVLAKGDATAGSIVVVLLEKGENPRIFERILQSDGHYGWTAATRSDGTAEEVPTFIARRRRFDPDLWVLELDVPSAERFADQMNAFG